MKRFNRPIYHCLACGAIKRVELTATIPTCCGARMVQAATETIDLDDPGLAAESAGVRVDRTSDTRKREKS